MEVVQGLSWPQVMEGARAREIDLLPALGPSDERRQFLLFTRPYLRSPPVIFARSDANYIGGLEDLNNRLVAVQRDSYPHERLQQYPQLRLAPRDTSLAAMQAVAQGEADAYIDTLAHGTYLIERHGFGNLKVAAPVGWEVVPMAMAVRDDWPELVSILNKGLAAITETEAAAIRSRWMEVRHELYGIDVDNLRRFLVWLVVGGGGVLLLAGGVMVWNRRLHGEVTRRKAAEQALRHNQAALEQATAVAEQANLAKGRFLANISHELRNPMNAVAGLCHLAREGAGEGVGEGRQREYLEGIQAASDTLLALLNDLLDLSRIEAGKLVLEQRPFDLPGLCEELLQLHRFAAEAKGIVLRLQLDPAIPQRLLGDPMRLRQILTNLLSNGVKFTAAGEVRLRVRLLGQPAQRVSLCFEVEDTGIGVPADQYATLFQPYEQGDGSTSRRFGGTGLGLSICRQLVERMGGEIGLDTERVQGALFYFRLELPVAAGEAEAAPPCAMLSEFQGFRGARVLVVDDSPINRRVARDLLGRWGIQAGEAANGAEALAALGDADWDLVLMDIRMPEMDGYETARRIREQPRLAGLPIVALTAHALTGDREGCLQAGMNDHLTKPIEPQRLHATLCRWLQASRPRGARRSIRPWGGRRDAGAGCGLGPDQGGWRPRPAAPALYGIPRPARGGRGAAGGGRGVRRPCRGGPAGAHPGGGGGQHRRPRPVSGVPAAGTGGGAGGTAGDTTGFRAGGAPAGGDGPWGGPPRDGAAAAGYRDGGAAVASVADPG
jgi:signal transduction histidine kinase/CheY-like chemotaxis protein